MVVQETENREQEMNQYEIDIAFEKKYNYRVAEKCCLNCKHGHPEYEGEASCTHPERTYEEGGIVEQGNYNCSCHNVCDAWERK